MKLRCANCKEIITDLSICKNYKVREDFILSKESYCKNDTEYFNCEVLSLTFKCKCGEVVIRTKAIEDFIRNSDSLRESDIKRSEYGILIVEK